MTERELFEREIVLLSSYPVAFDLDEYGNYKNHMLNSYWVIWQRARNVKYNQHPY